VGSSSINHPKNNIRNRNPHTIDIQRTHTLFFRLGLLSRNISLKMAFPIPKGIQNYHTDTYPGIDPTSSRLSTAGKQIVISGGGSGIGAVIARSFAKSGADSVSILGRTEKTLIETKTQLETDFPRTSMLKFPSLSTF
jgi:hypothetical protein